MTTTMKQKAVKKRTKKKVELPPLPPTARVVDVGGRDCVIVPLDEYAEWCEDQALRPLVNERLMHLEDAIPFAEMEERLDKRKKGK